jgi:hypothetical protein
VDLFRRGEVPREAKLLAARGVVAPRAVDQVSILVLLCRDADAEIANTAALTLTLLPRDALEALLARADVPAEVRAHFADLGLSAAARARDDDSPLFDVGADADLSALERELEAMFETAEGPADAPADESGRPRAIALLPVIDRLKLAMRGTREQRAVLVRDPNRLVSTAVLSSPKLTESEVESFARMGNVSDDVLRIIGSNRAWTKSYTVASALARNPKTPPAISMPLVSRLNERDLRMLSVDRNVPEGLRITARKLLASNESRRK